MKKHLPLLFLFMLLFTACDSKKASEENVPAAQATMNAAIAYAYNEPQSAEFSNYVGMSVVSYASMDTERLTISFGVPAHVGPDAISFSINKQQVMAGYVGTYTLKSLPNPANGAANVQYTYRKDSSSATMYLSNSSTMEGHFTITAYNAKHKLLSGSYEAKLKQAFDPKATQINQTDIRRCDITIQGEFTNVKIEQ